MGTKFTYRKTIKPKNKESKFVRENGVRYNCYRDENGIQHIETIRYRKLVRKKCQ